MLETLVTLFLVLLLVVAFIGVTSVALLLMLYGPGAAAGFAAGVTASRMGADPLTSMVTALVTFVVVTGVVMRVLSVVWLGIRALLGWQASSAVVGPPGLEPGTRPL